MIPQITIDGPGRLFFFFSFFFLLIKDAKSWPENIVSSSGGRALLFGKISLAAAGSPTGARLAVLVRLILVPNDLAVVVPFVVTTADLLRD